MGVNTFAGVVVAGVLTVAALNQCSEAEKKGKTAAGTGEDPNQSSLINNQVQPVSAFSSSADAVAVEPAAQDLKQFHCDEKCWDRIRKQRDNPIPINDATPQILL